MIGWVILAGIVAGVLFWVGYARGRATAPKPITPSPGGVLVELNLIPSPDGRTVPIVYPLNSVDVDYVEQADVDYVEQWLQAMLATRHAATPPAPLPAPAGQPPSVQ